MKKDLFRRECEVKIKLESEQARKKFAEKIHAAGFVFKGKQLEADFVPDTGDFLCRKNKMLLRIRGIFTNDGNDVLITLKIKRPTSGALIKDDDELQFLLSSPQLETFQQMNRVLEKTVAVSLPQEVLACDTFEDARRIIVATGFDKHRIYLEKKRELFQRGDVEITIDELPENVGVYAEIEAKSSVALHMVCSELGLSPDKWITKDYGDIMMERQNGLSEIERRTLRF